MTGTGLRFFFQPVQQGEALAHIHVAVHMPGLGLQESVGRFRAIHVFAAFLLQGQGYDLAKGVTDLFRGLDALAKAHSAFHGRGIAGFGYVCPVDHLNILIG